MIKRIETVEEYGADGKLTKKTINEYMDNEPQPPIVYPAYPYYPIYPSWGWPYTTDNIEITCKA